MESSPFWGILVIWDKILTNSQWKKSDLNHQNVQEGPTSKCRGIWVSTFLYLSIKDLITACIYIEVQDTSCSYDTIFTTRPVWIQHMVWHPATFLWNTLVYPRLVLFQLPISVNWQKNMTSLRNQHLCFINSHNNALNLRHKIMYI